MTTITPLKLPDEPEVLAGRQAFPDAQAALMTAVVARVGTRVACGWFGSKLLIDRGSFAYVDSAGELAGYVGNTLRVTYGTHAVAVYVVGSLDDAGLPLFIARRAYLGLAMPALASILVDIAVLR